MGLINEFIDTVNHELLIAKLHSYGYSIKALEVLLIYLQERWKRVPQRSVLGPILPSIYINDISFALKIDICNFADDTTPHAYDSDLKSVQ